MQSAGSALDYTESRIQRVMTRLRSHGYRMTPQRVAVVRALVESVEHPSAEDLYEQLLPQYPTMSPATVYKTVGLLKELGEVAELVAQHDGRHFEGRNPAPHPHIICVKCGRIVDLELGEMGALIERVASSSGFAEVSNRLEFWGVCERCQSGESASVA